MYNYPKNIKAYQPVCLCGQGAYGSVYLVCDAVGTFYALKIVRKTSDNWEREFRGLKHYKNQVPEHPNLIKIFHIEDCGDFFYYTMEAADNWGETNNYTPATLANLIKMQGSLSPDTIRTIFDGLLDGLEHLHNADVIHRDIKPDNIIFVDGVAKLSDIGLLDTTTHTLSLVGTQDFVPPEYLLGDAKNPTPEIDLYALGKTLYCAFSGNDANQFPLITPDILKNTEYRTFNKLVRLACASDRAFRLKSFDEFRNALQGNIGWKYELKRFLFNITLRPIFLVFAVIHYIFSKKWIIFLLITLFLIWSGMVIKTYWQLEKEMYPYQTGFHAAAFKRALKEWHKQIGEYDLYDFQYKSDFYLKKYGERYLVTRDKYLRAKHTYNPGSLDYGIGFSIGAPDEEGSVQGKIYRQQNSLNINQSTPLKYQYLYEKVFDKLNDDNLSVPDGTQWRNKTMLLPAGRRKTLKYIPELPLMSEVNITFNPYQLQGKMEFVLTAAEYLPLPNQPLPDVQWKKQMRFPVTLSGNKMIFTDILWRGQDKSEDEIWLLEPPKLKELLLEDRYYHLKIVTADSCYRVYLDNKLVWGTRQTFFGGHIELRYQSNAPLKINRISIYDTGFVQPGEKRKSRLQLPQ